MSDALPLAAGFPPAAEADWLAAVDKVLKGKPFEDLVTTTADGIAIQPLYTEGPRPDDATRGWRAGPWEVRQRVWAGVEGPSAVTELESGATGLLVDVPGAAGETLATALDGVHLELAPVSLATPATGDGVDAANLLVDLWESRGTPLASRAGTLGPDPIGAWVRSGGANDLDAGLKALGELVTRIAHHPDTVRAYVADGTVWHEAGATPVQELAWNIAAAVATVREVPDVTSRIEFRWAVDADQFAGIAKLRAARRLWARVAEVAGVSAGPTTFAAETSRAMLTRYDMYTNALRNTVATFAAGVGGADAVTVWPHDALVEPGGSPLGRRLARNTQTILQSESNLSRVLDLAGGSWYVETLTAELAAAAWAEVQRLDGLGGFVAAVAGGHIHAALDPVLTARSKRLNTRRQPLTGLSEFPDIDEQPPPAVAVAPILRITEPPFPPLTLRRLSEEFEAQRGRADQHTRLTGARPTVFLAQLGTPAQSTARTTFAKNLFEAAGIRTIAGPVEQFTASGSRVACLVSSDAVYGERGAAAAQQLRAAGATRIYAAGRRLDLPGVDEEVGMGSDVLDVLTRALDALEVR